MAPMYFWRKIGDLLENWCHGDFFRENCCTHICICRLCHIFGENINKIITLTPRPWKLFLSFSWSTWKFFYIHTYIGLKSWQSQLHTIKWYAILLYLNTENWLNIFQTCYYDLSLCIIPKCI
jgi:hypothetical protein